LLHAVCHSTEVSPHGVPVFLDLGGADEPLPAALLSHLTFLTANETELSRISGLPTESNEQVRAAAASLQQQHHQAHKGAPTAAGLHILLTLGERGSMLLLPDGSVLQQAALPAQCVDTTGAGDCFRGAFVAAFLEKKSWQQCMLFAAAAAALCIQVHGAMPSMPERAAIEKKLAEAQT
jgi:ribokinase